MYKFIHKIHEKCIKRVKPKQFIIWGKYFGFMNCIFWCLKLFRQKYAFHDEQLLEIEHMILKGSKGGKAHQISTSPASLHTACYRTPPPGPLVLERPERGLTFGGWGKLNEGTLCANLWKGPGIPCQQSQIISVGLNKLLWLSVTFHDWLK